MKLIELLKAIEYEGAVPFGIMKQEVLFVTDDSRKVRQGCVFVCVAGKRFDGHTVAAAAIADGALCVVAQRCTGAVPEVLCEDTRAAYAKLCAAYFDNPAEKLTLVGITGTNGKTTTAFLLKQIFDAAGYKSGLIGTLVNMVGDESYPAVLTTPDPWDLQSLFAKMAEAGCGCCFMEVSSQALDQMRVAGLCYKAAVFTNLTQDHLDYHGTMQVYEEAKHMLFAQTELGITNLDDEAGPRMLIGNSARSVTYSAKKDAANYTAKNIELKANGVQYELVSKTGIGRIQFAVPGAFSVYNSMAAAVTALEMGLPMATVTQALANSHGVTGRMEVVPTNTDFTVIIDYAHSPDGLENVLRALRETAFGRLITVFGCGGDRDATKRPIMGEIAEKGSDIVIVTSDNPRSEDPNAIIDEILAGIRNKARVHVEPDRIQAVGLALKLARAGDTVLLAGKGQETYQVLASGKIHLDEREIVRDILAVKTAVQSV